MRYRACGIVLLLLNAVLSLITLMASKLKVEIVYPGVLIFGMAIYTFYAVITTFIAITRQKKNESMMFSAVKISNFTAALVSVLSLEIAMTARFGAEDYLFRSRMTIITGTGIFAIIIFLALKMIITANKLIRE